MKKTLVIVATVIGVVLLGNVLMVSAQGIGPGNGPATDWMWQMHKSVWTAVAKELGMTYDELVVAVQGGQTVWQIAADKGVTVDRLREVMLEARAAALADLVKQGVITQEQADWMLTHSGQMMGFGGGPGGCHGAPGFMGGQGMMGGRGSRGNFGPMSPWLNPAAPTG